MYIHQRLNAENVIDLIIIRHIQGKIKLLKQGHGSAKDIENMVGRQTMAVIILGFMIMKWMV